VSTAPAEFYILALDVPDSYDGAVNELREARGALAMAEKIIRWFMEQNPRDVVREFDLTDVDRAQELYRMRSDVQVLARTSATAYDRGFDDGFEAALTRVEQGKSIDDVRALGAKR
jgi:hypothetical protein